MDVPICPAANSQAENALAWCQGSEEIRGHPILVAPLCRVERVERSLGTLQHCSGRALQGQLQRSGWWIKGSPSPVIIRVPVAPAHRSRSQRLGSQVWDCRAFFSFQLLCHPSTVVCRGAELIVSSESLLASNCVSWWWLVKN